MPRSAMYMLHINSKQSCGTSPPPPLCHQSESQPGERTNPSPRIKHYMTAWTGRCRYIGGCTLQQVLARWSCTSV
jgi:hypothetical protein